MMDELKQQFYEVMHKYQKPFSEEGVTANLTQWYEQKQGLLQFLRRHPLWNEKELAIVFRVEERREIDRITVDETRAAILELGRRACTDDTVYENFETALRAATADYARIPNEYRLDTIRQYGGIKCAPGQKASRIINRLCLKFHLDQIEEEAEAGEPDNRYMRTVKPYNALFARLADALNPAHIEKTAVLSIHPCDFLEMSNRDNTWSSCHCLEGGGYRGGCQSYMGDAVSMIFFTVSDEYTQDFHTAPRITREIFCYKDNMLLQSRLYPTDLEDQKTLYRSIVQQAVATCLDKPNLWSIKRGKETEPYCESAADSNHYPDYAYGYAVASLLKGETDYGKMTIGSVARCVCCGGEQKNHRSIRCAECGNMYVCKGCGKTVHGYGRYIDNHFYCNECSYECTVCKETVTFWGQELSSTKQIKEDVGVVFDGINFYETLTPAKVGKIAGAAYKQWDGHLFQDYLKRFQLPADKEIKSLSKGMKMKLCIAVALSHNPKLLILDEATSGLDPVMRDDILDVFLEFVQDENHSILMSSHITTDLEKVADYITFIHQGKVLFCKTKDELRYNYGIIRCGAALFDQLDKAEILAYRKDDYQWNVLVADKEKARRKYKNAVVDDATIDDILLLYVKGEQAK